VAGRGMLHARAEFGTAGRVHLTEAAAALYI
jgi:hypothetical protein